MDISVHGRTKAPGVSGAVLAGGASRRMGRDKRGVEVEGVPMLDRALVAVQRVASDVTVVTAPGRPVPEGMAAGARPVEDLRPDAGPLAGIEAALTAARHDVVVVLACDHPAAEPGVLAALASTLERDTGADAVALGTVSGPQPLVAAYRRRGLATVARLLDAGEHRARSLADHMTVLCLAEDDWRDADPGGRTALDVDTPEDLVRWEVTR